MDDTITGSILLVSLFTTLLIWGIWGIRQLWFAKQLRVSQQFKENFEILSDVNAKKSLVIKEILRIKVRSANLSDKWLLDITLRSISLLEDLNDQLQDEVGYEDSSETISILNKRISILNHELSKQRQNNDEYVNQIKALKTENKKILVEKKLIHDLEERNHSFQEEFGKFRFRYLDQLKNHDIMYHNPVSGITLCKTYFSIEAYIDDFLVVLKTHRSITFFRHEKSFTPRSFNQKINEICNALELDLHVRQYNYRTSIFFKAGHHLELEDGLEIIL